MPITRSRAKTKCLEEVTLPTEVVYHILYHLNFEDLLKCRFVKRTWNDAVSRLLRTQPTKMDVTMNIAHIQSIQKLLYLRSTAIQPNFFTKFSIVMNELNMSAVTKFGLEFGSSIRELSLDTRKKKSNVKQIQRKVIELIRHCPLIESLTIIGNNDGSSFVEHLGENMDLNRVKNLTLKSPFDPVLSIISHSVVRSWVTKLKSLSKLTILNTLDPNENNELEKLLITIGPLDYLSLCLRFKPENRAIFSSLAIAKLKIHALNLVVDMDEDDDQNMLFLNLYTWLAWQARYLTKVTHQLHTQITDVPIMSKLKELGQPLRTSGRSPQPFRIGQSSSLYFVSILSNDPSAQVEDEPPEPHLGIFANMEESIISINRKTSKILKYLFPNMKLVHSTHYFVA